MTRVGLLSDTHSHIDNQILDSLRDCDEIWHAGDVGHYRILYELQNLSTLRAVYGNIDDAIVRRQLPKDETFTIDGVRVFMTHIGGYPGRYNKRVRAALDDIKPDLYVCGHSHILKVMPDKKRDLIHMNPGACGHHGIHVMRTLLRFSLDEGKILDVEAVELGKRGRMNI